MEILTLLICAGLIVLDYFVAKEFQGIAIAKGYKEKKYFWWSFALCLVGWLMIIALPERGKPSAVVITEKVDDDELPDL